jgi:hypothetical protein
MFPSLQPLLSLSLWMQIPYDGQGRPLNDWTGRQEVMIAHHMLALERQFHQLYYGLAIAHALNRTLILPKVRAFTGAHPFVCLSDRPSPSIRPSACLPAFQCLSVCLPACLSNIFLSGCSSRAIATATGCCFGTAARRRRRRAGGCLSPVPSTTSSSRHFLTTIRQPGAPPSRTGSTLSSTTVGPPVSKWVLVVRMGSRVMGIRAYSHGGQGGYLWSMGVRAS